MRVRLGAGGFLLGARRRSGVRGILLRNALTVEVALVALATVLAVIVGETFGRVWSAASAAVLATALGLQNAVARRLAVPDLTTTVLTMRLAGLAS